MAADALVLAPAKVNLCLHITGQRVDGYHLLDSLVAFADFGDQVLVRPSAVLRLELSGPCAVGVPADGRNLVLKAARLTGIGADISLEKHLPAAAGIGGGSSDAAATLRALSRMSGAALPPFQSLMKLGADVPVCMLAKGARMRGVGEEVDHVPVPPLQAVLVNPGIEVPTPAVFAALKQKANPAMPDTLPKWRDASALIGWLKDQRNDLQPPAIAAAPIIGDVLSAIDGTGAALSRMSGSGATCFGVFQTDGARDHAAGILRQAHPDWWVQPVTLS